MRKAELTEGRIEHRPDMIRVGARLRLAAQQISAVGIAQRQWLATHAVAGQKPALEIDAPQVVGRCALCKGRARWRAAAPQATLDRQSLAVKQRPDGADRRPWGPRSAFLQPPLHLNRPPGRMRPAHRQAALGNLLSHRLWMMQRRPRAVAHTLKPRSTITLKPLVANAPTHSEASANRCKRLFLSLNRQYKAHPPVTRTGLHPYHRQGPPRRSVDLLPMSPVYCVTHVAGLDHPALLPPRGEGVTGPSFLTNKGDVTACATAPRAPRT